METISDPKFQGSKELTKQIASRFNVVGKQKKDLENLRMKREILKEKNILFQKNMDVQEPIIPDLRRRTNAFLPGNRFDEAFNKKYRGELYYNDEISYNILSDFDVDKQNINKRIKAMKLFEGEYMQKKMDKQDQILQYRENRKIQDDEHQQVCLTKLAKSYGQAAHLELLKLNHDQ